MQVSTSAGKERGRERDIEAISEVNGPIKGCDNPQIRYTVPRPNMALVEVSPCRLESDDGSED